MAIYRVQGPDGAIHKFEGPDDATPDQVTAAAEQQFKSAAPAPVAAAPVVTQQPQQTTAQQIGTAARVVQGIRDPIDAAAQMLSHAVSDTSVGRGINRLGDILGMPSGRPEDIDTSLRQREQEYQQRRAASGDTGIDLARLTGNVGSMLIPGTQVAKIASLPGRIAAGAATGAASGVLQPVTQGDFAEEKAKQAAIGGGVGAALPVVGGAVSRVINPQTSEAVRKLISEGVSPTIGQTLGGAFKTAEEKLTSVPLLGSAIKAGMTRAQEEFNRAAVNRSLAPIGQSLPKDIGTGREAVTFARQTLGKAYDSVLDRIGAVKADDQLSQDIAKISAMTQNLAKDKTEQFERIIKNEITDRMNQQGFMTSESLKAAESNLGSQAKSYASSADYDQRKLGDALDAVQESLRGMVSRSSPKEAQELQKINQGYANFKRVQRAAGGVGAEEGVFTAPQLQSAVRASDKTKDKRAFSEGTALMQDLSEAGKTALANKIPNSGTADRAFVLGSILNPFLAAGAAAPSILYAKPVQNTLVKLLANRPEGAAAVANAAKQLSARSAPALAQILAAQPRQ